MGSRIISGIRFRDLDLLVLSGEGRRIIPRHRFKNNTGCTVGQGAYRSFGTGVGPFGGVGFREFRVKGFVGVQCSMVYGLRVSR